ncbi:MAG: acetyltransferase [Gemmatimonadetes bacterium]|jgi:GNAT superfamily N-acetyltransferase|nr:acetyltransferase [Gemmatimonadota bacterium]
MLVTRTYLELRAPDELRRSRAPVGDVTLERRHPVAAEEYLALYRLVGGPWHWRDRLLWPTGQLQAHLDSPGVHVWVLAVSGETAGYFELQSRDDETEILYFGLAPGFIGRGLGGWLLTRAVEEALAPAPRPVVLNTCTLDGPHAMPNYLARGFRIVRSEEYTTELP